MEGLALASVIQICGGIAGEICIFQNMNLSNKEIYFDEKLIEKISGIKIPKKDKKNILNSLGFEISDDFIITVPSWRPDVSLPIDIVEEVIRIYGLNNVKSIPLKNLTLKTNFNKYSKKYKFNKETHQEG